MRVIPKSFLGIEEEDNRPKILAHSIGSGLPTQATYIALSDMQYYNTYTYVMYVNRILKKKNMLDFRPA